MGPRITWNGPLAWSLLCIGGLLAVVLFLTPPVARVVLAPRADAESVNEEFARLLEAHDEAAETYADRFNGRSAFFKPPTIRKPVVRPKAPPRTVEKPEQPAAPRKPTKPPYGGPSINAYIGDLVWFSNGDLVRVGQEESGLRVISSDLPRSIQVEYGGWEYEVTFRAQSTSPFGTGASSASRRTSFPGMTAEGSTTPGRTVADARPTADDEASDGAARSGSRASPRRPRRPNE